MARRRTGEAGSKGRMRPFPAAALLAILPSFSAGAATIEVGPGLPCERIEDAVARAGEGGVVLVHPRPGNQPYEQVAVLVTRKRVTLRAAVPEGGPRVPLSGKGFDYSGAGRVPRAIVQLGPGADGSSLQGFELSGAHNGSHNGAGVRVDRANGVSVLDCEIRGNDMGVMSNGDGTDRTGRDLRIERCRIHHNGDPADPGFNHNLYLGGTSATLRFCEVHSSLTGHNVKSRAHHTRLEWCWIHDSANREIDFVDAADTAAPDSHAVIVGCILAKASPCEGNRETIHFGQDGGKEHDGTLFLVHNTIVSPYVSAVVTLSAPKARCRMAGNLVCDGGAGQKNQVLAAARGGAETKNVTGERNWLSSGFTELGGAMLDPRSTWVGPKDAAPVFVDPAKGDFRLAAPFPGITDAGAPPESIRVPGPPGGPAEIAGAALLAWQYRHPAQGAKRAMKGRPDLGASEGCK